jgi:hypothetical protein
MPNTRKCFLRNHFQGKCFMPKLFSDGGSWESLNCSSPRWVLGRFGGVPGKSCGIPGGSWANPDRSWVGLGKVYRFENEMLKIKNDLRFSKIEIIL